MTPQYLAGKEMELTFTSSGTGTGTAAGVVLTIQPKQNWEGNIVGDLKYEGVSYGTINASPVGYVVRYSDGVFETLAYRTIQQRRKQTGGLRIARFFISGDRNGNSPFPRISCVWK